MGLFGSILKGVGGAVGSILGAKSNAKAVKNATQAQLQAQQAAIDEGARQFDLTRSDYAPYLEAGTGALGDLTALLGIPGKGATSAQTTAAQTSALDELRASPLFQSLYRTGEEAVLQNASATGGLRGGNTQRSLADFGAETFSQVLEQQLARLAGVAGLGSGATDSVSAFGASNSRANQDIMLQGGNTRAGGILGKQQVYNNLSNQISSLIGSIAGGF